MVLFSCNRGEIFLLVLTSCNLRLQLPFLGGNVCIFYETDAQIEEHENDGKSELLRLQIQHILGRNDRYHVFTHGVRCEFTSKQTLDEKYQGNMFYYHMR